MKTGSQVFCSNLSIGISTFDNLDSCLGPIPSFFGNGLLELRSIDLSFNALTGNLPAFGSRFNNEIRAIKLHDNRSGCLQRLPLLSTCYQFYSSCRNCDHLGHIIRIGGWLDAVTGNLTELTSLTLHNNRVGGSLPESMTNMRKIEELSLHNNRFSGSLPQVFSDVQIHLYYPRSAFFCLSFCRHLDNICRLFVCSR